MKVKGSLKNNAIIHGNKGWRPQYRSMAKWVKGSNTGKHNLMGWSTNNNLYGFNVYLNDGLKCCKSPFNSLSNIVYASIIDLKRGNYGLPK